MKLPSLTTLFSLFTVLTRPPYVLSQTSNQVAVSQKKQTSAFFNNAFYLHALQSELITDEQNSKVIMTYNKYSLKIKTIEERIINSKYFWKAIEQGKFTFDELANDYDCFTNELALRALTHNVISFKTLRHMRSLDPVLGEIKNSNTDPELTISIKLIQFDMQAYKQLLRQKILEDSKTQKIHLSKRDKQFLENASLISLEKLSDGSFDFISAQKFDKKIPTVYTAILESEAFLRAKEKNQTIENTLISIYGNIVDMVLAFYPENEFIILNQLQDIFIQDLFYQGLEENLYTWEHVRNYPKLFANHYIFKAICLDLQPIDFFIENYDERQINSSSSIKSSEETQNDKSTAMVTTNEGTQSQEFPLTILNSEKNILKYQTYDESHYRKDLLKNLDDIYDITNGYKLSDADREFLENLPLSTLEELFRNNLSSFSAETLEKIKCGQDDSQPAKPSIVPMVSNTRINWASHFKSHVNNPNKKSTNEEEATHSFTA